MTKSISKTKKDAVHTGVDGLGAVARQLPEARSPTRLGLALAGALVGALVGAAGGCAGDDAAAPGAVRVRISGEQAAKVGYPFTVDGETVGFVDGWTLAFTKVVASVGGLRLRTASGDEASASVDHVVVSLTTDDPLAWTLEGVPARRWDRVSYRLIVPPAGARLLGGATEDDAARLRAAGATLLVAGTARRESGGETYTFELFSPDPVEAGACVSGFDGTDGVVVPAGGTADVEITLHLDHFFLDTLVGDAKMRFEAIAATADAERHVSFDRLAMQDLTDLRDTAGRPLVDESGAPVVYDPGSTPLAAPNLREFVRVASRTVGHFNGEGHCEYTLLPR
jgi:hypothetical protein